MKGSKLQPCSPDYPKDGSYSDLLAWHLFYWGTRPGGNPESSGKSWKLNDFRKKAFPAAGDDAARIGLGNWLATAKPPNSAPNEQNHTFIVKALFGDPVEPQYARWRDDLDSARERSDKGKNKRTRLFPDAPEPPPSDPFGITTQISKDLSMPLGESDVHMIEMAEAFAILSAGGKSATPYGITKISTIDGRVIFEGKDAIHKPIVDRSVAGKLTDLLQASATLDVAKGASIDRPIAGFAGISRDSKAGWFFGFSSGIITCVWMGHPDGHTVNLKGGVLPANAFGDFMRVATKGRSKEPFDTELTLPERILEN